MLSAATSGGVGSHVVAEIDDGFGRSGVSCGPGAGLRWVELGFELTHPQRDGAQGRVLGLQPNDVAESCPVLFGHTFGGLCSYFEVPDRLSDRGQLGIGCRGAVACRLEVLLELLLALCCLASGAVGAVEFGLQFGHLLGRVRRGDTTTMTPSRQHDSQDEAHEESPDQHDDEERNRQLHGPSLRCRTEPGRRTGVLAAGTGRSAHRPPTEHAHSMPTDSPNPRGLIDRATERFGAPARRRSMFDADRLLFAAKKEAGLHDFGDGAFREGLDRLLDELAERDDLDLRAAGMLARSIENRLVVRLQIRNAWKRNEAAEYEVVRAPLLVVGLPGSGTTRLGRLLAQDPLNRAVTGAEVVQPVPVRHLDDPAACGPAAGLRARLGFGSALFDAAAATPFGPVDDAALSASAFRLPHTELLTDLPGYRSWVGQCDMGPAMAHHRQILRLFQATIPVERWLLRSAWHLQHLPAVAATYPDARVVWIHRDPAAALVARLTARDRHRRVVASPTSISATSGEVIAESVAAVTAATEGIESWPHEQVFHLQHAEFVEDPEGAVERIYRSFDLELPDVGRRRMQVWAAHNPVAGQPPMAATAARSAVASVVDHHAVRLDHADYTVTHRVPAEPLG